jgi:hypothetical protein
MGKFNSKVEQIESRTASRNGLCSTFEGPLCITSFHASTLSVYVILVTHNVTVPHRPMFVIIGLQTVLPRPCKCMFMIKEC